MSIPEAPGPHAGTARELAELLPLAITAAQIGGEVLRRHFGALQPGQVRDKSTYDPVSVADSASEEAIVSFLARHTPGFAFLAEEGGASGGAGPCWVLDPLDGTLNFVRRFPHFGVSVALRAADRLALGVIYDPMRDQLFTATAGGGAFCNGTRISVSGRASLAGAFVTTGFPYRVKAHIGTYLALFRDVFDTAGAIRRPGAATLDLAHTACGIFDAFFEFSLAPWDIAAGVLLVREAGGVVTNLEGGADVLSHGNVVAGSPGAQRELLALAMRHTREGEILP